ncbi:hypothetical protein [Streptomyces sp. 7N604]|uniref:hypothetical protein n=1 Tax=Streptomyces sp. 7N604 TaxID=3457415 RepID=UPI003FD5B0DC
MQDAPIYDQLIAERGDVLGQVRSEAEQMRRQVEQVMRPGGLASAAPLGQRPVPSAHR